MDPPPPPPCGGRSSSRYGSGSSGQHQFPFVVDPTEAAGAAAVRAFFPAHHGEPPPSSSGDRAPGQQRYGEISLGHGQGMHHHHHRYYHQFGVEGKQLVDGGPAAPRHSSSPPGFFSSPVVDNGECHCCYS
jgi:hypothetical protein